MKNRLLTAFLALQAAASLVMTGVLWSESSLSHWSYREPQVTTPPPAVTGLPPQPGSVFRPLLVWAHLGRNRYVGWPGDSPLQVGLERQISAALAAKMASQEPLRTATRADLLAAAPQVLIGMDLPLALTPAEWAAVWGSRLDLVTWGQVDRVVVALDDPGAVFWLGPQVQLRQSGLPAAERLRLLQILLGVDPSRPAAYEALDAIGRQAVVVPSAPPVAATADDDTADDTADAPAADAPAADARPTAAAPPRAQSPPSPARPAPDTRPADTAKVMSPTAVPVAPGVDFDPWVLAPVDPTLPTGTPPPVETEPDRSALLPRFFPDTSVVREIEERDGATIFTDGQRAMRFYRNGALEYRAPDLGEARPTTFPPESEVISIRSRLAAVRTVQEFAAGRVGWPEGLRLVHMAAAGVDSFRLYFAAQPDALHLGSSGRPLLEAHVTGTVVTYFYLLHPPGRARTAGALAVDARLAVGVATQVAPQAGAVRWVRLGEAVQTNGDRISVVPAWSVGFADATRILIDARTGRIVP